MAEALSIDGEPLRMRGRNDEWDGYDKRGREKKKEGKIAKMVGIYQRNNLQDDDDYGSLDLAVLIGLKP